MLIGRVLVVEDDAAVRGVLARGLRGQGAEVVTARDGASALALADHTSGADRFDAVVLDIGLPDSDGRDVCQALRARGVVCPVLFLTARDGMVDVLSGFAAGGDEYLSKPFHFPELIARLAALLRRGAVPPAPDDHGVRLDPRTHALTAGKDASAVRLTPTEYRLLATLLATSGEVVRRRALVGAGWPDGAVVHDNTLDQYVTRLRRKLRAVDAERQIVTVHGVGYELR